MRPVQLADLEMAARVLMCLPNAARVQAMQDMIGATEIADAHCCAQGTPHPQFGAGTLLSCAAHHAVAPRPAALGKDALHAYWVVLQALMAHPSHQ